MVISGNAAGKFDDKPLGVSTIKCDEKSTRNLFKNHDTHFLKEALGFLKRLP